MCYVVGYFAARPSHAPSGCSATRPGRTQVGRGPRQQDSRATTLPVVVTVDRTLMPETALHDCHDGIGLRIVRISTSGPSLTLSPVWSRNRTMSTTSSTTRKCHAGRRTNSGLARCCPPRRVRRNAKGSPRLARKPGWIGPVWQARREWPGRCWRGACRRRGWGAAADRSLPVPGSYRTSCCRSCSVGAYALNGYARALDLVVLSLRGRVRYSLSTVFSYEDDDLSICRRGISATSTKADLPLGARWR